MNNFNTLSAEITRKALDELWLHVSHRCNLSCKHCLFACSPLNDGPGALLLGECQSYVSQALTQGLKSVYITGGEPLLWPELFEFLDWYYSQETVLPLTILTNGTLITEEVAKLISIYTPQGLNIRISMECYTRENHEEFRGQGSFDRVLSGIRNLNLLGIRPWVAYVNKSGGSLDTLESAKLANDFDRRLKEDYNLDIKGLKIIAAYSKGRFEGEVHPEATNAQIEKRIATVQCAYGVAVSKLGVVPCPILSDVPEAVIGDMCSDLVGQKFTLEHDFCSSCFATGTSCGQ